MQNFPVSICAPQREYKNARRFIAACEQPCQTSVYRLSFPEAQTSRQRLHLFSLPKEQRLSNNRVLQSLQTDCVTTSEDKLDLKEQHLVDICKCTKEHGDVFPWRGVVQLICCLWLTVFKDYILIYQQPVFFYDSLLIFAMSLKLSKRCMKYISPAHYHSP